GQSQPVHHLHQQKAPTHQRLIHWLQTDSPDHFAYPHVLNSLRDRLASSESSRLARTKHESRLRICWRVLCGYSIIRTLAATSLMPCSTVSRQVPTMARKDGQRFA